MNAKGQRAGLASIYLLWDEPKRLFDYALRQTQKVCRFGGHPT
jgi:hypothetical protein